MAITECPTCERTVQFGPEGTRFEDHWVCACGDHGVDTPEVPALALEGNL